MSLGKRDGPPLADIEGIKSIVYTILSALTPGKQYKKVSSSELRVDGSTRGGRISQKRPAWMVESGSFKTDESHS